MLIKSKDLKLREIKDKATIAFVYDLVLGDDENKKTLRFYFHNVEGRIWQMEVCEYGTVCKSDVMYRWGYEMPKDNMALTMICAYGLSRFQIQMKHEVQMKSEIDFALGDLLEGLYG